MEYKYSLTSVNDHYKKLEKSLTAFRSRNDLYKRTVNLPFKNPILTTSLDLGIIVLLQVNKKTDTIDRVALSDTYLAEKAVKVSAKDFKDIKIPTKEKNNLIANVIKTKKFNLTEDWYCLFNPELTAKQARLNQANAGIECSLVFPLSAGDGGALIFSFYQPQKQISEEHVEFINTYALLVNNALETCNLKLKKKPK